MSSAAHKEFDPAGGESGTIAFSANTTNTTSGTPLQNHESRDGCGSPTAATINKTTAGQMISSLV